MTTSDGPQRILAGTVNLVATGSRPFRPAGIPFDDPDVDDSDTILELDAIPTSLVVIGGGPVGSEYASIFAALGVEVTIIDGADQLLPQPDIEVSALMQQIFTEMGIRVLLASPGARVERTNGSLSVTLADGGVLRPHKVLFAAGRVGNTEGLGLDQAGVALDQRRRVVVDRHFRTTAAGVYAAGDVIGPPRTQGMIKPVLSRDDRRLLGVHIVGEEAAVLVHIGQALMHGGGTIGRFLHPTFNIPTRSEVYKYAAYDALQNLAAPPSTLAASSTSPTPPSR